MKIDLRRITLHDEAVNMNDHMEPYEYLRSRCDSHNVVGINYAEHYIRRSKYVGWAMVLNEE